MKATREAILSYSIQHKGDWKKIARSIQQEEPFSAVVCDYAYVTIVDDNYPSCFLRLRYPPWTLFYQGSLDLLKEPSIGIVGARECSQDALRNTKYIVQRLKGRYQIVSGLAKGVDAQSHRSALDAHTVGIIGCGIDWIYPKENTDLYQEMRRHHLILSEYPPHTPPYPYHFPWRNRLIASCIDALIVVEAKYKSGTMLTVDACNELSVPVYCVPSAFLEEGYKGCNYLIACGAQILLEEDLERIVFDK